MREQINDFTTGNIPVKLAKFMIPILGALILQAMYGAVDLLVVGWFGTTAGLSAVSTGSNIINLIVFVTAGLSMGVTVLLGRYIGEQREERCGKVIGGAVCFFAVASIVIGIFMLVAARPLSILMQAPEEALDLTVLYVRICGGGILFIIAYNMISSIFRGLGNSRLPLIFVAIACVVNIIGDLVFVAGFHMNVAGAALATVMAQAVSVILSVIIIRRQQLPFSIQKEDFRFNSEIRRFLKVGTPIALQEILTQLSFLALCAFINRLGLDASSGYGVASKIVTFVMLIPSSLMQSMASFVAQNVGAGKEKRARQSMLTGMAIGASIGVFIMLLAWFKGDILAGLFTNDPLVIMRAAEYLKGFCPEAIVTSILFSFIGYYNGHSKTVFVMLQGLAQTFLVRLPMSYVMSIQPNATLTMIGLAAPTATCFGIIINTLYFIYLSRKMKKQNTEGKMNDKKDIFDKIMSLPLLNYWMEPYKKYKEILLYLFFGGLTSVVSIGSYAYCVLVGINPLIANIISWILAVTFAYFTNKIWVFQVEIHGKKELLQQMLGFYSGRLLTLGIEEVILLIFITKLGFNSLVVKIAAQVVVVISNYVISKCFVFKEKKE